MAFPDGVVGASVATTGRRSRTLTARSDSRSSTHQSEAAGGDSTGVPRSQHVGRRRLQTASAAAAATVTVADVQFNTRGQPSDAVESSVTSIRVTATGDGEVHAAPLESPFCYITLFKVIAAVSAAIFDPRGIQAAPARTWRSEIEAPSIFAVRSFFLHPSASA